MLLKDQSSATIGSYTHSDMVEMLIHEEPQLLTLNKYVHLNMHDFFHTFSISLVNNLFLSLPPYIATLP